MRNIKIIIFTVCTCLWVQQASAQPLTEKIIDGTPVSENELPYVAKLMVDGELLCTGTLINTRFVLTAAHCFFDGRNRRAVGDTDLVIRLGGQQIASARAFIHPSYVPRSSACVEGEVDAAVVELASDVSGISPIPLLVTPAPVGATLLLAGYGTQGNGSTGEDGTIPDDGIVNRGNTILEGYGSEPPSQNNNSTYFFWTFDAGESNTASGDSGGPAFYDVGNQPHLAGITCGGDGNAEQGTSSFNTRVDLMAAWIQSIAGIAPADSPPAFTLLSTQVANLGQAFSYRVPVTGSLPISLSLSQLPDGLSFDGSIISGTPTTKGTYTVNVSASNAFGSAASDLIIVVSGFEPTLTMRKVLLQFDADGGNSDFLDITGKITVGPRFNPRKKTVTIEIGRFSKTFRLDANGQSTGSGKSYFDLIGAFRGSSFAKQKVGFALTLERVPIFDELATLGFPASDSATEGQEVPLPVSITIKGIRASETRSIFFRSRDARWKLK